MAFGQKIIPIGGVNLDAAEIYVQPNQSRFVKNLVYELNDTSEGGKGIGAQTGVFKPLQSNYLFADIPLPTNPQNCGRYQSKETNEAFAWTWGEDEGYVVYRINGGDNTYDIVYRGAELNLQLAPENFIHEGAAWLEVFYITNPDNNELVRRTFLFFTDNFNNPRQICVEDSIATDSYNADLFPYFNGDYDKFELINMGVKTPMDCIGITEVERTEQDKTENNNLLFNTWQFRVRWYDVWGRPSEYGVISDTYIPGFNDCFGVSSAIPRCLDLSIEAPPPYVDKLEIAFRNCNDTQWYTDTVLDLYDGSPFGEWWLRTRNTKVDFNSATNKITYRFCKNKECKPIAPENTNRLYNPLPKTSVGLSKINQYISLQNNKDGFSPFSKTLLDKITATIEKPTAEANATTANIDILVEIFNPMIGTPQSIWSDDSPSYKFGGVYGTTGSPLVDGHVVAYKQYFTDVTQKGWYGYLVGAGSTISKQYYLEGNELIEDESFKPDNSKRYFQRFQFSNVPRGQYVFRIASHRADLTDTSSDPRKTSTYVAGQFPFNGNTFTVNNSFDARVLVKELEIDACDGDYSSVNDTKILVIWDLSAPGISTDTQVADGYVYSTATSPVELIELAFGSGNESQNTDHNGFYFTSSRRNGYQIAINGNYECTKVQFGSYNVGAESKLYPHDFIITDNSNYSDFNAIDCNKILITGRVVICGTNIGIPNVPVVLTRGQSVITDSNGDFTITAYDDIMNGTRRDKVYVVPSSCNYTACDGTCVTPQNITIQQCVTCDARVITLTDFQLNVIRNIQRGLLTGETYPWGVTGFDWMDRATFVQPLGYLNIPTLNELQVIAPVKVKVNIAPDIIFPDEIKRISFWIGEGTTIDTYLDWIVDKVTFIDNTGSENLDAPTQIKIDYASVIEYSKQNNYNTTTAWDFIVESTTQPFTSDKVYFFLNGDGKWFNTNINALIKYAQDGQYFLINYDDSLKDLKENALIRLVRPKTCSTEDFYYEVCSTIELEGHGSPVREFYLNAFDTYYLTRQIPVPITEGEETIITQRNFGFLFEHDSPSNFWGKGCKNVGRVNSSNPYEAELISLHQFALSGALSVTGQLNFLNYFTDADKISFPLNMNGIVSALIQTNIILVLGQTDWALIGFDDNLVRSNEQGIAVVGSIDNKFGKPQIKVGNNYGCLISDKNTISVRQGIVQFLDATTSTVVQHNFTSAIPISEAFVDSYVKAKIKDVKTWNLTHGNKRYFTGCINPVNNEYLVTDRLINDANYINNLRYRDVTVSETFAFDVQNKVFKGWYSFLPENYCPLESEITDQQLFSFKNGLPYAHYNALIDTTYNTFYGTVCNRVLRVIMCADSFKKKKQLWIEIYGNLYFASEVITETKQVSRILKAYFNEGNYMWGAPFLCDTRTPTDPNLSTIQNTNKILEGNTLIGTWIDITLVGDPDEDAEYTELQGVVVSVFPSEKSGTE